MNHAKFGSYVIDMITTMAPRILKDDFKPCFFIKHFIKDMKIAKEKAQDANLELHMLDKVLDMCKELGTQAVINIMKNNLMVFYITFD